jgi:hypothetical protein
MKVLKVILIICSIFNSLIAQNRYYPIKPDNIEQGTFDYYKNMLDAAYEKNDLYVVGIALANMGENKDLVYKVFNQAVEEKPANCYAVHSFNNLLIQKDFKTTLTKLSLEDWQKLCAKCLILMDSVEFNRIHDERERIHKEHNAVFFKIDSSKLNLDLMNRLSEIMKKDQFYRIQMSFATPEQTKELWQKQNEVDEENLKEIEDIIKKYGFPTKYNVGDKCDVAIYVLHHCSDIKIHEKYLSVIEALVAKKELEAGMLNMFKNRIVRHNAAVKK